MSAAILFACSMIEERSCRAASTEATSGNPQTTGSDPAAEGTSDLPLLPTLPPGPVKMPLPPYSTRDVTAAKESTNLVPDEAALTEGTGPYEGMVLIPAGTFEMGSQENQGRIDEQPVHKVFLKDFYLAKKEVTVSQYCEFLGAAGLKGKDGLPRIKLDSPHCPIVLKRDKFVPKEGTSDLPMVCVSLYGAADYARWAGGRLPTEAEWEKAAWMTTPYLPGDYMERLHRESSVPVQAAFPGFKGVSGMVGNVWEWCSDWYAADYYGTSPTARPTGPTLGTEKVVRGGSWASSEASKRIRNRHKAFPRGYYKTVGFRVVKD
jgi:formylglycine-generating enzyme